MSITKSDPLDDPQYRRRGTVAALNVGFVLAAFYISTWGYRGDLAVVLGVLLLRYGLLPFVVVAILRMWKQPWLKVGGAFEVGSVISTLAANLHLAALRAEPEFVVVVPCCTLLEALILNRLDTSSVRYRLWSAAQWIGLPLMLHLVLYVVLRHVWAS